jgi:hypothetical protein
VQPLRRPVQEHHRHPQLDLTTQERVVEARRHHQQPVDPALGEVLEQGAFPLRVLL